MKIEFKQVAPIKFEKNTFLKRNNVIASTNLLQVNLSIRIDLQFILISTTFDHSWLLPL